VVHVLLLVRHAKAVGEAPSDAERALAPRGVRDAAAAGRWLLDHGLAPDHALVSPAIRAVQTWDSMSERFRDVPPAVTDDRIYENSIESLLSVVHDTAESLRTVAIVGHNPSMHALAAGLDDGDADSDVRASIRHAFPTMGIAVVDVTGGWADLELGTARLREVVAPRN
jgi:phosphohistidine phosphatase